MSNKLILWSGGYDSTILLLHAEKVEKKYYDILTIETENNSRKNIKEAEAREKILDIIKPEFMMNHFQYKINAVSKTTSNYPIPSMYLNVIMHHIQSNHSAIQFGAIGTDTSFLLRKHLFLKAYDYLFALGEYGFEKPKMEFPLIEQDKTRLIYDWFYKAEEYIPIREHIWTCEMVDEDMTACGKCHKCIEEKRIKLHIAGNLIGG